MSEQLYDGELGTAASNIMYVKPFICVVRKYLQVPLYPLRCTFFHKEHLRKAAKVTCTYFNVIALKFKIQKRLYSAPNSFSFQKTHI